MSGHTPGDALCYVCGSECEGTTGAVIDDVFRPMCHENAGTTCYMRWQQHQVTPLLDLLARGIS